MDRIPTRVDLQVRASGHASKCRNVPLRGAVANDKHVYQVLPGPTSQNASLELGLAHVVHVAQTVDWSWYCFHARLDLQ